MLAVVFGCFSSVSSFAQFNFISDSRSVSGSASVNNVSQFGSAPYYTTSYTGDYSGSAAPALPFADFQGNANGSAVFQGGISFPSGPQPFSINSTTTASQNSFLHSQEIFYSSVESAAGFSDNGSLSGRWMGQGSSLLSVTFQVAAPTPFSFVVAGTGDSASTSDSYSLTSSGEGTLLSGNTFTMVHVDHNYGGFIDYSGIFNPGNTYTLILDSVGNSDGGGLQADLTTVPEPSLAALAGLAFAIFRLRGRRTTK